MDKRGKSHGAVLFFYEAVSDAVVSRDSLFNLPLSTCNPSMGHEVRFASPDRDDETPLITA